MTRLRTFWSIWRHRNRIGGYREHCYGAREAWGLSTPQDIDAYKTHPLWTREVPSVPYYRSESASVLKIKAENDASRP